MHGTQYMIKNAYILTKMGILRCISDNNIIKCASPVELKVYPSVHKSFGKIDNFLPKSQACTVVNDE